MEYSLFDAHCDTLLKVFAQNENLYDYPFEVNIQKLEKFKKATQIFAIFNEGSLSKKDILEICNILKKSKINFVTSTKNLSKTNAMLSIEGLGNTPNLTPYDIDDFFEAGIRVMSLTWNQNNPLCGGISENNEGLSLFGKKVLAKMDKLKMVLDVSHISEKGFFDCFENFEGKIVATHSNAKKVCAHIRNLTDEQFLHIKSRGGVVGINLYPLFINNSEDTFAKDAIKHIEHFLALGGENNIGIGADFDGIDYTMKDVCDVSKMDILFNEMKKLNYSDDIIDKISHKNFENIFKFD